MTEGHGEEEAGHAHRSWRKGQEDSRQRRGSGAGELDAGPGPSCLSPFIYWPKPLSESTVAVLVRACCPARARWSTPELGPPPAPASRSWPRRPSLRPCRPARLVGNRPGVHTNTSCNRLSTQQPAALHGEEEKEAVSCLQRRVRAAACYSDFTRQRLVAVFLQVFLREAAKPGLRVGPNQMFQKFLTILKTAAGCVPKCHRV